MTDGKGTTIEWVEANTSVTSGVPSTLRLTFDGILINDNHINGPYYLQNLLVYNTSDPLQSVTTISDYQTQAYGYEEFEGGYDVFLPFATKY